MKKLLLCCSLAIGLTALSSGFVSAACPSWCSSSGVTCSGSYACNKCVSVGGDNCSNVTSHCKWAEGGNNWSGYLHAAGSCNPGDDHQGEWGDGRWACCHCLSSCAMASRPKDKQPLNKANGDVGGWVANLLDMIAAPVHATNCWSGGTNFGFRDSSAKTNANGTSKQCEAKLHVCFAGGDADSAIPCTVNTTDLCDNKCNPTGGGNGHQIACSQTDCQNRCYAARVPGNPDTCN